MEVRPYKRGGEGPSVHEQGNDAVGTHITRRMEIASETYRGHKLQSGEGSDFYLRSGALVRADPPRRDARVFAYWASSSVAQLQRDT